MAERAGRSRVGAELVRAGGGPGRVAAEPASRRVRAELVGARVGPARVAPERGCRVGPKLVRAGVDGARLAPERGRRVGTRVDPARVAPERASGRRVTAELVRTGVGSDPIGSGGVAAGRGEDCAVRTGRARSGAVA